MASSLQEYVDQAIKIGATPDQIKAKLSTHGWDTSAIDEALHHYQSPAAPTEQHESRYIEPGEHIHVEYAPLKRRIAAFMVDYVILLPLNAFVGLLLIATGREGAPIILPVWLVAVWFYFAIQESLAAQATFGKKLLGIYVVRSYGEGIDFRRASLRFFTKFLSLLPLGLGLIWMKYNDKGQTFHDLIADTVVTIREPNSNQQKIASYTRLGEWGFLTLIVFPIFLVVLITIYNLVKPTPIPQSSGNPEVTGTVTAQSRDASRKSDIASYATFLASYNSSQHSYPLGNGDSTAPNATGISSSSGPLKAVASAFPSDPLNGQTRCQPSSIAPKTLCSYHYLSNAAGTSYVVWADLELPGSGGGVYFADSTGSKGLLTADPTAAP